MHTPFSEGCGSVRWGVVKYGMAMLGCGLVNYRRYKIIAQPLVWLADNLILVDDKTREVRISFTIQVCS